MFLDNFGPLDFVNVALSAIPSAFEKLAFLGTLKNPISGHYYAPLADLFYGEEQIDVALQWKHHEIFSNWLGFGLAVQTEEVARYLANRGEDHHALISVWLHDKVYESLIPAEVSQAERSLFSSDIKTILQLLQGRLGASDVNEPER